MIKSGTMLTIWRRHSATCPHRDKGREFLKCNCPLWADGYVDGKRILRQSLKTCDMARARKRAVSLESPDAIKYKPLAEAVKAFLVNCQHLNANTQRKYKNRLEKQLAPFCEARSIDLVSEPTVEILDDFRAGRKLAVTRPPGELEALRHFLAFCVDRGWIAENPAAKIKPPRNARPEPVVPYTPEEVRKMLAACSEIGRGDYERKRAQAMVLLLRHTALRISDVALLERARVQKGEILLHTHKTGETVRLPIPAELEAALERIPTPRDADKENSRFYFINGTGSARTAISVVERCLRAVFKKSGVAGAHAHRFRHTLATELLGAGASFEEVADILGNSPEIVRKHYAKWSQARQDRITSLMRTIYLGTKRARGLKLVVSR